MKISKKVIGLITIGLISSLVVACNPNKESKSGSGSDTKKEQSKEDSKKTSNKGTTYKIDGAVVDKGGVVQTIKSVTVFNNPTDALNSYNKGEIPFGFSDEENKLPAIVLNFEVKNNNKFKIETDPGTGVLVTDSGEQAEANYFVSENFAMGVQEGVTADGNILIVLKKTDVDKLKNFKYIWKTHHENGTPDNYGDDYSEENKLDITLSK